MPRRRPINLSRAAFHHLAAALGVAVLSSSAFAAWTVTPSEGAPATNVTVNTWTPTDGLSATDAAGKLVRFATRDLVSLTPSGRAASNPQLRQTRWKLALRNGDVLYGSPVGFSGQSFTFKVPEIAGGTGLSIPLKAIATLSNPKADSKMRLPPAAADKDIVRFLANNDQQAGIVADIQPGKLQLALEGAETPTDLPLDSIAFVQFGGAAAPRSAPPLSVRLTFASGTTYTMAIHDQASAFNWSINKITLKDSADHEYTIPSESLTSVDVLGGRVVFLTELDAAADEQVSLLGTRWPVQINKNVLGLPLRVARTDYARGIGVHTQSTLVYALDGSFETLSLQVGLDDSAAPQGEAVASVVLDGKTLWKSDTLHPGQVSPLLNLPISGGKRLELHADPASHLDILGRVNWLNPALKRK